MHPGGWGASTADMHDHAPRSPVPKNPVDDKLSVAEQVTLAAFTCIQSPLLAGTQASMSQHATAPVQRICFLVELLFDTH